jgi:hypothetical protein
VIPLTILSFLSTVQWGSVGEWFGGILTSVGVIIALAQIRDVKRAERTRADSEQRSNAMAVTVSANWQVEDGTNSIVGSVQNSGSLPIFEAQVHFAQPTGQVTKVRVGTVGPGARSTFRVEHAQNKKPHVAGAIVQGELRFRDAQRAVWSSVDGMLSMVKEDRGAERDL